MPDYEVQTTLLNAEGNSLSAEMKTFYEKQLIETAQPALVHDQFGTQYTSPRTAAKPSSSARSIRCPRRSPS